MRLLGKELKVDLVVKKERKRLMILNEEGYCWNLSDEIVVGDLHGVVMMMSSGNKRDIEEFPFYPFSDRKVIVLLLCLVEFI